MRALFDLGVAGWCIPGKIAEIAMFRPAREILSEYRIPGVEFIPRFDALLSQKPSRYRYFVLNY